MTGLDWSSGRLGAGGRQLEYACFGPEPGDAATLVLLHDGLGCVALWRDFPERLAVATGLGVLVYSRAGYGTSEPEPLPRPLDFQTQEAHVLSDVLEAAGIRRAILLGHSDGATMAAIHAGSLPTPRVRGLILIAPHFFVEAMGIAEIARAREAFETGDLAARLARYHMRPEVAFRSWADCWLDPGFADWNVADALDYIRVPILAIQGEDDQYGTLAQIAEVETRAYCPVETLILPGCRHNPHLEQPDKVLESITMFVARLERMDKKL